MKGFIQVTEFGTGYKMLCAIDKIIGLFEDTDGVTVIEMNGNADLVFSDFAVRESFTAVSDQIASNALQENNRP